MDVCGLDKDTVARLTASSPYTVISWLKPETSKAHRNMPDWAMDMIEMKLSVKKHTGNWT
jgi:hypothetical protein